MVKADSQMMTIRLLSNLKRNMRISLLTILFGFIAITSFAQTEDFGAWGGLSLKKKLSNDIRLSIGTESRFYNNASQWDKQNFDLGGAYELTNWIKMGVGYRMSLSQSVEKMPEYAHRLQYDIAVSKKLERLKPTFRVRWQSKWSDLYIAESYTQPTNTIRTKFGTEYNIYGSRFKPFVSVEGYVPVWAESNIVFDKLRGVAGVKVKMSKKLDFDAFYLRQSDREGPQVENLNVLGLGASYKL